MKTINAILTIVANVLNFILSDFTGRNHVQAVRRVLDGASGRLARLLFPERQLLTADRWHGAIELFATASVSEVWIDGDYRSIQATPWIDVVIEAAEKVYRKVGGRYRLAESWTCDEQVYRKKAKGRGYEAIPLPMVA